MADLNISPVFHSSAGTNASHRWALVDPPRAGRANMLGGDAVEPSSEDSVELDDSQLRDAILIKTALEGKDYQTARREALKEKTADPSQTSSSQSSTPPPTHQGRATTNGPQNIEAVGVQVTHVEADITIGTTHLSVDATRVEAVRITSNGAAPNQSKDPLVLDLSGDGPQTTGAVGAKTFDLSGDGKSIPTSFVRDNTALLALDRNQDGQINSGKELFGDQYGAMDGYEELRKFDSDSNGVIDAVDPVYSDLQLLFGDGRQVSLTEAGVQSISLNAQASTGQTTGGDGILRSSEATGSDGRAINTYALSLQRFDTTA